MSECSKYKICNYCMYFMPYDKTSDCGDGMCTKIKTKKSTGKGYTYFTNYCKFFNHTIHNRLGLELADDTFEMRVAYRCRTSLKNEIWINQFRDNSFIKFDVLGHDIFLSRGTYY